MQKSCRWNVFCMFLHGQFINEESYMKRNIQKRADFSVLMSLYMNEKAEYFDACMKSILRQTVLPEEIVIVKDGLISEEVERVLQKYIVEQPELYNVISYTKNRGLGYALAKGVEACKYELIARMDTDD